ncbi:MAG: hybrid sensor histidine kinase/response regulator [Kiloniellaceae bacterium]
MSDERISIIEDTQAARESSGMPPWQVLVVDDDDSVHQATRFALDDFNFEDRELQIASVYSAAEARQFIAEQQNTAVILLDVVMESEYIGLELVRWIRDELHNSRVRIVLRTGQPGYAPEFEVVRDYDINDYKEKSEMTAAKLVTTVYSALRSFRDIVSLESQAQTLEQALQSAESDSRAKSNFIDHMSHEFRTPLNGILGLSEMIATEVLGPVGNEKYKEYAWDIVSSGRRLLAMVESVLEFSDSGDRMSLEFEPFDLRALISEIFEHDPNDVPIMLEQGSEPQRSFKAGALMLHADRHAVQTMLMNLVSNALKHNPPGCNVRVTARQQADGGLVLSVMDDGTGIEPAVLKRLGKPFNIDIDPYVSGETGLGLGLVATKRLIERHGGQMTVESDKGRGTTVRLHFPSGSLLTPQGSPESSIN